MTKSTSTILFIVVLIVTLFPVISNAQLLFNKGFERPDWALEAAYYANSTSYDMQSITDNFAAKNNFYLTNDIYSVYKTNDVELEMDFDLEVGLRYKTIHFGLAYSTLSEISASHILQHNTFMSYQPEYKITAESHEFRLYAGYMHPVSNWLDIGAYGSVGLGDAKGKFTNDQYPIAGEYKADEDIEGDYTPWRVEGRAMIHISKVIAVSLAGGYRFAEITNMGYNVGLDNRAPMTYHVNDTTPTDIDWSGTFFNVGITLKNPYEK
jgi:hypothetical protein